MSKAKAQTGLRRFSENGYELPVTSNGAVGYWTRERDMDSSIVGKPGFGLAAVVLLSLFVVGSARSNQRPLGSILLYPKSTIEFTAGGQCAVVTNTSEGLVFVPANEESWLAFIQGDYAFVNVKACGV